MGTFFVGEGEAVDGGGWRVRFPQAMPNGVVPRYLSTEAQCQEGECPSESENQEERHGAWKVGHTMSQTGEVEQEISGRLSKGG